MQTLYNKVFSILTEIYAESGRHTGYDTTIMQVVINTTREAVQAMAETGIEAGTRSRSKAASMRAQARWTHIETICI